MSAAASGMASIDVKNKFAVGDELELILPDGNRTFRLEDMLDMDGTLLDHHSYSFSAALPALQRLRRARIPVIPVTSKTLAELAPLMRELDNAHPCIAENGGLIALPPGYFAGLDRYPLQEGYRVIELSSNYEDLLRTARRLRADHQYQFRGFSDMSDAEVAACTGLSVAAATRARRRRCSEPLQWLDTAAAFAQFRQAVETAGLQLVQGGRFWHLMGSHDKASAMQRLCEQYRAAGFQGFSTVALGDSPNDVAAARGLIRAKRREQALGAWRRACAIDAEQAAAISASASAVRQLQHQYIGFLLLKRLPSKAKLQSSRAMIAS